MKKYMPTPTRRNQILSAALKLAESDHYQAITREQIARRLDIATGTISRVFGTMGGLRDAIIDRAIEEECLIVIGQAIAANDCTAALVPVPLRRKALAALI